MRNQIAAFERWQREAALYDWRTFVEGGRNANAGTGDMERRAGRGLVPGTVGVGAIGAVVYRLSTVRGRLRAAVRHLRTRAGVLL